jgi:hypothetical protein
MNASRPGITAALVLGAALVLAGCSSGAPSSAPSAAHSTPPAAHHPASAAALAGRLKAAGLPVQQLIVYTATTDPNHLLGRQGGYSSKVEWSDPRAIKAAAGAGSGGVDNGGSIEFYPTVAGAQARYTYIRAISRALPFADGYDYLSGTAVLRLSRYLTPAQASAYRAAFTAAVQQP